MNYAKSTQNEISKYLNAVRNNMQHAPEEEIEEVIMHLQEQIDVAVEEAGDASNEPDHIRRILSTMSQPESFATSSNKESRIMKNNNGITLVIVGLLLLLVSIPATWMTIRNPTYSFNGAPLNAATLPPEVQHLFRNSGPTELVVTGMNSHVTVGIFEKVPTPIVIGIGIIALIIYTISSTRLVPWPKASYMIPLFVSGVFVLCSMIAGISSDQASMGIGSFAAAIGLICGAIPMFKNLKKVDEQVALPKN